MKQINKTSAYRDGEDKGKHENIRSAHLWHNGYILIVERRNPY